MSIRKTNKPKSGGILILISGVFGILGAIGYSIGFGDAGSGFGKGDMPPFVPSIIFGMSIPSLIISLLALAGGIFALQRKKWAWALTGSIAAALSFILLGIPAIVLIAMSKDEFV
ncbi:hypothetical protein ACFLV3_03470 [Chloroflexota bacterium]